MLDGATSPRNVVVPHQIVIYYKSKRPTEVRLMPQGVQLLAGNVAAGGVTGASFVNRYELFWSCGENGNIQNEQASIPTSCAPGLHINATIRFPQCIAVQPNGDPVLSSSDFVSHTLLIDDQNPCPSSHPYRVPQITYLVYWPNGTDGSGAGVANWRLSSDKSGTGAVPGGSLHGDWLGGWNQGAAKKWTDGCFDPLNVGAGPRNCSNGQTGTDRRFPQMNATNAYEGPNFFLKLPE